MSRSLPVILSVAKNLAQDKLREAISPLKGKIISLCGDKISSRMNSKFQRWQHPGGKLRELGAETLNDAELLSILIAPGIPGKPAEKIAQEILEKFGGFKGIANQPLEKLLDIKGLGDTKIIRIAATFEIARRIVNEVLKEHENT